MKVVIQPPVLIAVAVVVLIFVVVETIGVVRRRRDRKLQQQLRDMFKDAYRISLSENVRVTFYDDCGVGSFSLSIPRWEFANSDGSRDKRRKANRIIVPGMSSLSVGCYTVTSSDATQIVWLANTLREKGEEIQKTLEEQQKQRDVLRVAQQARKAQTVEGMVACFSANPSDFEEWCAGLLRQNGYQAEVTPPSRDGGYDITFVDSVGRSGIAECKCFNVNHKVGRPLIQKLVGANASMQACRLLFMTTSSFTPDAFEYAKEAGVELLDGSALVGLGKRDATTALSVSPRDWMLSWEDLAAMYPPDYPPPGFGF